MKQIKLFLIIAIFLIIIKLSSSAGGGAALGHVCGNNHCEPPLESWENCAIDCLCPLGLDYNPTTDQCEEPQVIPPAPCGDPTACEVGDSCTCPECNVGDQATCQSFCIEVDDKNFCDGTAGTPCKDEKDCPGEFPYCIDSDGDGELDSCGSCGGNKAAGRWDDCDSICESDNGDGVCDGLGRCDTTNLNPKCNPQGYIDKSTNKLFSTTCQTDDSLALYLPRKASAAIKKGETWSCDFCNTTPRYEGASCNLFANFYGTCDTTLGCVVSCTENSDCPSAIPFCNQFGVCGSCAESPNPQQLCQEKNNGYCDRKSGACIGNAASIILTELNPTVLNVGGQATLKAYIQNRGIGTIDASVEINTDACQGLVVVEPIGEAKTTFKIRPSETKVAAFNIISHANSPCNIKVELYQNS